MSEDPAINEDQQIARERSSQNRRALDRALTKESIRVLNPRRPAICLPLGSSAHQVIATMIENAIGNVLITDSDGKLAGIVTERDIVRKAADSSVDLEELPVEKIMTPDPDCLGLDDRIVFALHRMGVREYRHVPLVDKDRRPVGSISTRYIIRYLAGFFVENGTVFEKGKREIDYMLANERIRQLEPRQPAVCIDRRKNAAAVIELMLDNSIGHVLVVDADGKLEGIVTERDLVRKAIGVELNIQQVLVEEIMTPDPQRLSLEDPIVAALQTMGMSGRGFRHVPLVDADDRPVGSMSTRYINRYLADFFADKVLTLPPEPGQDIPSEREGE